MLGSDRKLFLLQHVPFSISLLSLVSLKSPLSSWLELVCLERQMIPEASAKDYLCRTETRYWVCLIVVDEESTGYPVCVQGSTGRNVIQDESFPRLNSHLCSFVSSCIVIGGDSVTDTIPGQEGLHVMTDKD